MHSMQEEEERLNLLLPLFKSTLSGDEINSLTEKLIKARFVNQDDLQFIMKAENDDKVACLFEAILKTRKRGVEFSLPTCLDLINQSKIAKITEKCFENDENVLWILRSWNDLIPIQATIHEIAWMLTDVKLSDSNPLLDFIYFMASAEPDSKMIITVVDMLKQKMSTTTDSSLFSMNLLPEVEAISTDTVNGEYAADVEGKLFPLIPLLQRQLTSDEIVAIATQMHTCQHLSDHGLLKVSSANTTGCNENLAHVFADFLKDDAKAKWQKDFLAAVKVSVSNSIFDIIAGYFVTSNEHLLWILKSWDTLHNNLDIVKMAAGHQRVLPMIDSNESDILVSIVHGAIVSDKSKILEDWVQSIQTALSKRERSNASEAENASGEPSLLKHQAITREYVGEAYAENAKKEMDSVFVGDTKSTDNQSSMSGNTSLPLPSPRKSQENELVDDMLSTTKEDRPVPHPRRSPHQQSDLSNTSHEKAIPVKCPQADYLQEPSKTHSFDTTLHDDEGRTRKSIASLGTFPSQAEQHLKVSPGQRRHSFDVLPTQSKPPQISHSSQFQQIENSAVANQGKIFQNQGMPLLTPHKQQPQQNEPVEPHLDYAKQQTVLDPILPDMPSKKNIPAVYGSKRSQQQHLTHAPGPQHMQRSELYTQVGQSVDVLNSSQGEVQRRQTAGGFSTMPGSPQLSENKSKDPSMDISDEEYIDSIREPLQNDTLDQAKAEGFVVLHDSEFKMSQPPDYYQSSTWQHKSEVPQMPTKDEEVNTYSAKVKGGKASGVKCAKSVPQADIKMSEPRSMNDFKKDLNDYQKLAKQNKYMLEFRAKIYGKCLLPENSTLCVYTVKNQIFHPMCLDEETNTYVFMLEMPSHVWTGLYKYCYFHQELFYWENIPTNHSFYGYRDRSFNIRYDQKDCGHAIMFDAVVVDHGMDFHTYEIVYQKSFEDFLPLCSNLQLEKDYQQGHDIISLYDIFLQLFVASVEGMNIKLDGSFYPIKISVGKKDISLLNYVQQTVVSMTKLQNDTGHIKRILAMLALACAMEKKEISFSGEAIKVCFCNGLSLHDITSKHQSLLLTHLLKLLHHMHQHKMITRSYSQKSIFSEIFQHLSNVPECILFFPLYGLIQTVMADHFKVHLHQYDWKKLRIELRKKYYQKSVKNMAEKIVHLAERFPAVCKKYAEVVSVDTTAALLNEGSQYTAIFDFNAIMNKLLYFWNELTKNPPTAKLGENVAVVLSSNLLRHLEQKIKSVNDETDIVGMVDESKIWLKGAETLLARIKKHVAQEKEFNIRCILFTMAVMEAILDLASRIIQKSQAYDLKQHSATFQNQLLYSVEQLVNTSGYSLSAHDVEFWNCLCNIKWHDDNFKETWVKTCQQAMITSIPQKFKRKAKAMLEFYAEDFDDMKPHPCVSECFMDVVTAHVEDSLEGSKSFIDTFRNMVPGSSVLKVCMRIFEKQWTKFLKKAQAKTQEEIFLEFSLKWNPLPMFIRILKRPAFNEHLTSTSFKILNAMENYMLTIVQGLKSGRMAVACLQKLSEAEKPFWDCFEAMHQNLDDTTSTSVDQKLTHEIYENLLHQRHAEFKAFLETKTSLAFFMNHFASALIKDKVKLDDHQGLRKKLSNDVLQVPLFDLVRCKEFRHGKRFNITDDHDVIYFPLKDEEKPLLQKIVYTKAHRSGFILRKMKQEALKLDKEVLTTQDIIIDVWQAAIAQTSEFVQTMDDGTMDLKNIADVFGHLKNATDKIANEIKTLYEVQGRVVKNFDKRRLPKRFDQIQKFFELRSKLDIAEVLDRIREKLELNGNFKELKLPLEISHELEGKSLNSIDMKLSSHVVDIFQHISEDQAKTLKQFIECEKLIEWVRQNITSVAEVKVLSDLAMISAGERPMDVARVSCFQSAVMGFAPLLFDLPKTAGFQELLATCKVIWMNVERNQSFLVNWEETSKHLEWLNYVKDFHGSVEEASLTRAQQINERGVYTIGGEGDQTTPNLKNCLRLYLHQEESQDQVIMTLHELRDLQSRLMLIAGEAQKEQQDVKKFITVLSSVENLAKAYMMLKISGCLLFSKWRATLRCTDQNASRCVTVEVAFDDKCPVISSSEDIIDEVGKITTVLNESLQQWLKYLADKRTEHYHINHYNIHQLTYLCKQLAKVDDNDISDQIYTLLASVVEGVNYDQIMDCLDEATRIDDVEQEEEVSIILDESNVSRLQKKKKVVRKLVALEIAENVAKASVHSIRSLDVDECYLWCLENEFDEERVDELQKEFDAELGFEAKDARVDVIQNVVNDRSNLSLQEVIERIHNDLGQVETIATSIKTVCERYFQGTAVTSLDDCVSIEHFGQFLAMLGSMADKQHLPKRVLPHGFFQGKPNLIVCQPADVWRTLLNIYMHSPEQTLPTSAEVLVCCESTATEDVELLLRRAIQSTVDEGNRIFCIACADQLSFDVAKEAEKIFQNLTQMTDKNDKYQLVVVTSSSHHYLTALFDEYQVDNNFPAVTMSVEDYLKQHLCVKTIKKETAAKVDRDQSSVRVVFSDSAGMGKSLFISRCRETLAELCQDTVFWNSSTIRFLEKHVNMDDVIATLTQKNGHQVSNIDPHFIHIDITPSVQQGVLKFLFDLVVLRTIQNSRGVMWRHRPEHFYAIEYTKDVASFTNMLSFLPSVTCLSPIEVKDHLTNANPDVTPNHICMDAQLLKSEMYQRPYQYLLHYKARHNMDKFTYKKPIENPSECLQTLLAYCSMKNPSWLELSHFSKFLNLQLNDCEKSVFLDAALADTNQPIRRGDVGLFGFKEFVVRFMIRMSQDFATPSLNVDEDDDIANGDENDVFELHQLRRRWESGFHPYLFFNNDRVSMSFVHFNVSGQGHLCHPKTNNVVENNIMTTNLFQGLKLNGVNVQQDFDKHSRQKKLETLCQVFGIDEVDDPDPTYELTTDNCLKMMAIQMRFRCSIPVIVMGETGCGKTRMVEFMSRLKAGRKNICNMVVVKVHGGVTVHDIQAKVTEATELARKNKQEGNVETMLFLDEANTTEAIYAIKEIVCDGTVHGKPFKDAGLRIVAACNPYRRHTEEVIKAMEKSGLGFNVKAEHSDDKFAGIPMRHLVYRVISLPPSMKPLVWDFGQLNNETEATYIWQMVDKLEKTMKMARELPDFPDGMVRTMTNTLSLSQQYMRDRRDTCSFVSLRDVERTVQSFEWFYKKLKDLNPLIEHEKKNAKAMKKNINHALRALIQALGMCYHATLEQREEYRTLLAEEISRTGFQITPKDLWDDIVACQNVFINAIDLQKDIAKNEALRENVFMIVLCAEMRIPLFLVGKPGSSKSLAKTVVTDAMQGRNSKSELFQQLKQIQVLSFQCSAVSDAIGIENVFSQCAELQKKQDLEKFVAVVVLDEIGLAEDSKKMPLKVLHPLLETASLRDNALRNEPHSKVGFVGISNWALDPAKMNRGIFVTRGEPSESDLHKTAEAMFESDHAKMAEVHGVVKAMTDAYLKIYRDQKREFFGLRDYYSLLKMLFSIVSKKQVLEFHDVATAVLRNFSGYTEEVMRTFAERFTEIFPHVYQVNKPVVELISENLHSEFESRFLLLLTNQYSAVSLLPRVMENISDFLVIFGSSFPRDNDYTEVCRNINRIKVCMETGRAIVLLNLRDLYESLYDALNQHYVTFAGERYVDLGLGGHRVKCRVKTGFRLIVIEEKDVVYNEFPIPLINRLEKYVFEMSSVLDANQMTDVERLKEWMMRFSKINVFRYQSKPFTQQHAFAGCKDDTPASALLSTLSIVDPFEVKNQYYKLAQEALLQTAALDAVCRLPKSELKQGAEEFRQIYMECQQHDNLWHLLQNAFIQNEKLSIFEVTSFAQILNEKDRQELERRLRLEKNHVMLITLQQFKTEQEYSGRLQEFLDFSMKHTDDKSDNLPESAYVLLIQCPQAHLHGNLLACAKYSAMNKVKEFKQANPELINKIIISFIFTLERHVASDDGATSFTSFHSPDCASVYVDELKPSHDYIPPVSTLWNMTVPQIFERNVLSSGTHDVMLRLLRESITEAMSKLKNQVQAEGRHRVGIVNGLCFGKNNISDSFQKIILEKIHLLLGDRENQTMNRDNWIIEEACSLQALQEGGTFRKTLWLRLKKLVATALAKIISTADVDNNLDIIVNGNQNNSMLLNAWFKLFKCEYVCQNQWSIQGDFIVQRQINFTCRFPFARLIHDKLYRFWKLLEERNIEMKLDPFVDKVKNSPLQPLLSAIAEESGMVAIKYFIHDLVHLKYKSLAEDTNHDMEYEVVEESLLTLFKVQRRQKQLHNNALVDTFIIFMHSLSQLNYFAEIIAVNSCILTSNHEWIEKQSETLNFEIHNFAFDSLLKKLQTDAPNDIGKYETCKQWKSLVAKTKYVADKLISDADESLQKSWKQIVFVEIFLDQLVPSSANQESIQHYLTALSPLARRLWVGASKLNDLSNLQFLNIITKTLQGCTKDIHLRLLCSWNDIRCRSCKSEKLDKPVLLPCKHRICQKCVPHAADSSCPQCRTKIVNPDKLMPIKLSLEQTKEFEVFKSACTSFFLEYLSTFCFPPPGSAARQQNRLPPDAKITEALENLVICEKQTRAMSPLQSNFDVNPTARSYILQLLLRCDRDLVQHQLNDHFNNMGIVLCDKQELMGVYTQCIQDILHSQFPDYEHAEHFQDLERLTEFFQECVRISQNTDHFGQIQHLDLCARLQFVARLSVFCIVKLSKEEAQQFGDYQHMLLLMKEICNACKNPKYAAMKEFIVKTFCRQQGIDSFNNLLENGIYQCLIPPNLIPKEDRETENWYLSSDLIVLSGESYINTKALLLDVVHADHFPNVFQRIVHEIQQSPDSITQILLALSVWAAHGDVGKKLREETYKYMMQRLHMHLSGNINQHMFQDIAFGQFNLKIAHLSPRIEYRFNEFINMVGIALMCKSDGLLSELYGMITNPDKYAHAFLPTMPASNYFAVRAVMQLERSHNTSPKSFLCPNGHVYFIGECTNPVQGGICPECRKPIGGQRYGLLQPGNQAGELTEASQAGYRLGTAEQRTPVAPDRKLTKLSICATRLIFHAAMLLGTRNGNGIEKLVKARSNDDAIVFLIRHMQKDMEELSTNLGKSIDDTFVIIHQVLHRMRTINVAGQQQNCNLQSMAAREIWEEEFQRHYLSLVFKKTDEHLNNAQNVLIQAGKFAEKPLHRLVYELQPAEPVPHDKIEWHHPCLWKYRIHISVKNLKQRLEAIDSNAGGEGAVLKTILNMEDLEMAQHLYSILSLQSVLISSYRQKMDMKDTDEKTLEQYLQEDDYIFVEDVNTYMRIWNKVKDHLVQTDRYNTPHCYFKEDLTLQSPISMCLPSKRGRGCCALVLAEYLTNKQNNLLQKCRELITPRPVFPIVDVPQLSTNNLVCINEERDLMPLIRANAQYETTTDESGPKHNIAYNIGLLEKKVLEHFVLRKAIINIETIPLMQYPQDMGLGQDFNAIKENHEQVPLPARMCQEIDAAVEEAMTVSVCEAVRTLTLVIQFLAKLGGEAEQTICDYAERDLLLSAEETEMIPRSALIHHCLALYERLSWHRSRKLAINGQNPFENVLAGVEDIEDEEVLDRLKEELSQMNIQRLQLELNSLIMAGPEVDLNWRLGEDVLLPYLDGKHDGDNSWCERLPEDILFKHAVHVYMISMGFVLELNA
ncbi:E3 ubiquitin-protein ligase rnf213-alpha-like [Clavelina lepadiformis]|uniref:E3 ubiquitin-protein ligase rnf213-alpha-like n=1 Tax=Clavelina lepadiformis TaxID=159417 RepID=UPI004041732F